MVVAHTLLLWRAQTEALEQLWPPGALKELEQSGDHLQVDELGKATNAQLMVQRLVPEAQPCTQQGTRDALSQHWVIFKLETTSAFVKEKDHSRKNVSIYQEMSLVAPFSPLKKLFTDLQ